MLWDKNACLKATLVVILLFSLFDVAAMAQSAGDIQITHIVNGSNVAQYSIIEPDSSLADGNWIVLQGGDPIRIPATSFNYDGALVINDDLGTEYTGLPFFGMLGINDSSYYNVKISPHNFVVPYDTYPVYLENDNVKAVFYGSPEFNGKDLQVRLLDLTKVSDKIDFTDPSTIKNSMKLLTLDDIKSTSVKKVSMNANSTGDIESIDSASISELGTMPQGYYALVVMDESLPDNPCIVAETPIIVTKNRMDSSIIDVAPKPGDSITFIENQQGAPAGTYTYIVAMIPEANYTADINVTSDGTISGTFVTFHGLSLEETFNVASDGTTINFDGLSGHKTLTKDNLQDAGYMEQLAKDELAQSNIAFGVKTTTTTTGVDIEVPTKDTMPTGKYIILAAAVDRDTGKIAAINQTTINLGATWEYHLYAGWNLISVPLKPDHTDISEFFPAEAMNAITVVWQYNSSNPPSGWWSYYTPKTDLYDPGTLTTISEKYGYWVLCDYEITFQVTGTIPSDTLVPINSNNWNLVGNPTIEERPVADVYTDIDVIWQFDGSQTPDKWWSYYTPKTDLYDQGTLTALNPGFGYWILK